MKALAALLGCATLLAASPAGTQQVREIRPIEHAADGLEALQRGAPIAAPLAVPAERVDDAMRQVVAAWNERELEGLLPPDFRDRTLLLEALRTRVPRRATLVLVEVQRWQIVAQAVVDGTMRTRVHVTARTRLEYTDDAGAYRPREGVNDYDITLRDSLP